MIIHSFETRPGLVGRPGAETGPDWRKNRGKKNPVWPGQKPDCNPLTFVFLLKRRRFNFKKIWPGDPVKTRNPGLGRVSHRTGSKNYAIMTTNTPYI